MMQIKNAKNIKLYLAYALSGRNFTQHAIIGRCPMLLLKPFQGIEKVKI
jgi:hypothetical protein